MSHFINKVLYLLDFNKIPNSSRITTLFTKYSDI